MDQETRIQQFKQMTQADPENELGHFSLGKAYLEADRPSEAITPLTRAIELNARMSKAHQLLGEALDRAGQRDHAIETLTKGVSVADEQGDRVPRDAMVALLRDWGAPVPEVKATPVEETAAGPSVEGFRCTRCGQPSGQLPRLPFKSDLGKAVYDHVCATCWREWIAMGTKVINELGLALANPESQKIYDQYMVEFLQLEDKV